MEKAVTSKTTKNDKMHKNKMKGKDPKKITADKSDNTTWSN